MQVVSDLSWSRRGLSILWGAEALQRIATPSTVLSLRESFALSTHWPEELPSANGNALVVVGVDGCLDALHPEDAARWLEIDFRNLMLSFQDHYENQAAIVLWLPNGRRRIAMPRATEEYGWNCTGAFGGSVIPLGRCLWAGADSDVRRILDSNVTNQDPDGPAWIGLNHPRIS
jgi:hypothetical protein